MHGVKLTGDPAQLRDITEVAACSAGRQVFFRKPVSLSPSHCYLSLAERGPKYSLEGQPTPFTDYSDLAQRNSAHQDYYPRVFLFAGITFVGYKFVNLENRYAKIQIHCRDQSLKTSSQEHECVCLSIHACLHVLCAAGAQVSL